MWLVHRLPYNLLIFHVPRVADGRQVPLDSYCHNGLLCYCDHICGRNPPSQVSQQKANRYGSQIMMLMVKDF